MKIILFTALNFISCLLILPFETKGQSLFTIPKNYIAYFNSSGPVVDGNLNDPVWKTAAWTDKFIDIEGPEKPLPPLSTRVKMAWNDSCLFIAAELQESHVWAKLNDHDDIVFHDNDFEVFLDPGNDTHTYFEIEVNALNTIFDLFMAKPYRNGGSALISWHADGLRSAVQVQGTLNNPDDLDKSWTVEMAIPFSAVSLGNHTRFPKEGDFWRINFSRVQWDTKIEKGKYIKLEDSNGNPLPEHNWVWSPQGVINMHYPERWGYLIFSRTSPQTQATAFALPAIEKRKQYLWQVYYKQKEYYDKHGHYAATLKELELKYTDIVLEATQHQFLAMVKGPEKEVLCINQEGFIQRMPNYR